MAYLILYFDFSQPEFDYSSGFRPPINYSLRSPFGLPLVVRSLALSCGFHVAMFIFKDHMVLAILTFILLSIILARLGSTKNCEEQSVSDLFIAFENKHS